MDWERSRDGVSWSPGSTGTGDDVAWRFRTAVACDAAATLRLEGVGPYATVLVDGEPVAEAASQWLPVDLPFAAGEHRVEVRVRPLAPMLLERRKPRARWRTAVCDNALRFHRTTLLGRAPGFAPGPPVVGVTRPARWLGAFEDVVLLPRRVGDDGVLEVRAPAGVVTAVAGGSVEGTGELVVPGAAPWMPHTHGTPHLHDVTLRRGEDRETRRVGFRALSSVGEALDLRVEGIPVFARGAVWTPVPAGEERATLQQVVELGMNLVRVVGTGAYEPAGFHALCDELGLLVWQDLMFANLDYPFADDAFRARCRAEVAHQRDVVAGHASLAVVCGSSESEQQVAMLGLDPMMARSPFFDEDAPELLADLDAIYLPSAPSGPDRPFRPDTGVANWFGVGGYRRPLSDTRRAGVRFASECLAFANLPAGDAEGFVPRDVGADWDFADVRDVYLRELHGDGAPPAAAELVTGEVMADVFGEWRRAASPCRGGIVLWLRDREPGAGWGVLDVHGAPKPAAGPLARALAPVAVWTTDEGQSGIAVHVANDGPEAVRGTLRLTVYRDGEHVVEEVERQIVVAAHGAWTADAEDLLGRWMDLSYTYRFGPPQHDLVVAAFAGMTHARRPLGAPAVLDAEALGVEASLDGDAVLVRARRAVQGVQVRVPGCAPVPAGALVEPGRELRLPLRGTPSAPGVLSAVNLAGTVAVG